jgi:iron(III) transport system ATP-binding protein
MTQSPPALALSGLCRRLGAREILKDIALTLAPGRFLVLADESGSGKTTLIRLIAGLDRPDAGTVHVHGALVDDSKRRFVAPEQRRLGMVFQEFALWPHLSCLENVALALPAGTADRNAAALAQLDRLGVAGHAQRRPAALSGGQQQRVGIARALAARPRLLLLDEPLSSLDMETRNRLREELLETVREAGVAAVLVSHDPEDCWQMADEVAVLEGGAIRQQGTPQDLWAQPASAYIARFTGAAGGLVLPVSRSTRGLTISLGETAIGVPGSLATPRAKLYWREGGVRMSPNGGIPAVAISSNFDAGRFRVRWHVPGVAAPLVSFEPAPVPPGPGQIAIDPEKLLLFAEPGEHG